jgi:hypothetical protein
LVAGAIRRRAQRALLAIGREGDAVHRADVDTGVAFDAQLRGENRLHVAVQAPLGLVPGELRVETQLHLLADVLERDLQVLERHLEARLGATWLS